MTVNESLTVFCFGFISSVFVLCMCYVGRTPVPWTIFIWVGTRKRGKRDCKAGRKRFFLLPHVPVWRTGYIAVFSSDFLVCAPARSTGPNTMALGFRKIIMNVLRNRLWLPTLCRVSNLQSIFYCSVQHSAVYRSSTGHRLPVESQSTPVVFWRFGPPSHKYAWVHLTGRFSDHE